MNERKILDKKLLLALQLVDSGCSYAAQKDIDSAISCFKQSIGHEPTPEAYTYWGWMLSMKEQLSEAIELCKKAIAIDPDFGNPYNDIGSYLMRLGKMDEAMAWLEMAKLSKRYAYRHYPHINLGRIYFEKGWLNQAIKEFESSLQFDPENDEIKGILRDLHQSIH
ncbi:MAG: tetratricopeptide repeat protein [Deltaproteobacteria bacterium]|nr:tetratricopeptide repeat protein [Deltaproteobacteria bacterium]